MPSTTAFEYLGKVATWFTKFYSIIIDSLLHSVADLTSLAVAYLGFAKALCMANANPKRQPIMGVCAWSSQQALGVESLVGCAPCLKLAAFCICDIQRTLTI